MNPFTHLLIGWEIGCLATKVPRDRALITCASVAPDLDGLGILVDAGTRLLGYAPAHLYLTYHHSLFHGLFGAVIVAAVAFAFAQRRIATAVISFVAVHI